MSPETSTIFIQIGAAIAAAMGVWGLLSMLGAQGEGGEERLSRMVEQLKSREMGGASARSNKRGEELQKKVTDLAMKMGQGMKPSNEAEIGKMRLELLNAGFRRDNAVMIFLGIKVACFFVAASIAVPIVASKYGMSRNGLIYMVGGSALGLYAPGLVLGFLKKKRQEQIFLSLPDALDLMVVCVEAGLGLDAAMRRVAAELVNSAPILCEEIAVSNFHIQMGRTRKDVLRDLGVRTGVNDVRALAAVLIQAERFGSGIASALRVQSDSMRTKRRQLAEERAAKTAVKLLFPLILFIFPGIFVVLVGPAAISIKQTLMK